MVLRRGSGLPVYLQVVDQLRYLITAGRYRPGDYLPPMRQVAEELGLNLNTILRAYAELQRDGLIQSTRGKGAVVRPAGTATADINRLSERGQADSVDAMIYASVEHALSAGLDPAMILARTQRALDAVGKRAPVGPLLAMFMTLPWRSNVYAEALRSVGIGRVRPISTWEEAVGCDLVIRPTFGSSDPVPLNVGAPTLDVALLLDRRSLRELGEIESDSSVLVVAGDERVATWLADAVAGYAGAGAIRRVVADAIAEDQFADEKAIVIERGMPRVSGIPTAFHVIQASGAFPASIAEAVEAATRPAVSAGAL